MCKFYACLSMQISYVHLCVHILCVFKYANCTSMSVCKQYLSVCVCIWHVYVYMSKFSMYGLFACIFLGFCELFAKCLADYGIKETRVPVEDVTSCSWIDPLKVKFYHNVNNNAVASRQVFSRHQIKLVIKLS